MNGFVAVILVSMIRITVGSSLLFAGLAKLKALNVFDETIVHLGVSPQYSSILAVVIASAEILVSTCCFVNALSAVGGVGTLCLGLLFAGVSLYAVATRRHVSCACFGVAHGTLGWGTLWRAGAITAAGLLIVATPMAPLTLSAPSQLANGVAIIIVIAICARTLSERRLKPRLELPALGIVPPGTVLPDIVGMWADTGESVSGAQLYNSESALLFLDYQCRACWRLASSLGNSMLGSITVVLAAPKEHADRFIKDTGLRSQGVVIDEDRAIHRKFGLKANPVFVTTRNGYIGRSAIVTEPQHIDLVRLAS